MAPTVGELLTKIEKDHGLSANQMAKILDMSNGHYSLIKKGDRTLAIKYI